MRFHCNFIPADLYDRFVVGSSSFLLPPYQKKLGPIDRGSISVFNDYTPNIAELATSKRNILVIQEPNQLFGLHDWAIANRGYFDAIFTWGEKVLAECPNGILHPFGTSFLWETPDFYRALATGQRPKAFSVSFLCGQKRMTEGHHLRHRVLGAGSALRGPIAKLWLYTCPPGAGKNQCWDSMFHVAIENTRNKDYFTEKIIDCFLTKTIPIYWGCPNLPEYFNKDGFITFENEHELIEKIASLREEDYHSRSAAIQENYEKALYHGDFFYRFNETLETLIANHWKISPRKL